MVDAASHVARWVCTRPIIITDRWPNSRIRRGDERRSQNRHLCWKVRRTKKACCRSRDPDVPMRHRDIWATRARFLTPQVLHTTAQRCGAATRTLGRSPNDPNEPQRGSTPHVQPRWGWKLILMFATQGGAFAACAASAYPGLWGGTPSALEIRMLFLSRFAADATICNHTAALRGYRASSGPARMVQQYGLNLRRHFRRRG